MKIQYPLQRINSNTWIDDQELMPLFDGYIYTSNTQLFRDYFYNKEFADCNGDIYKVIDKVEPASFWRKIFKFIPGVYKSKLIFRDTHNKMALIDFKKDLINGIRRFDTENTKGISDKWIQEIEKAKSIKEILS